MAEWGTAALAILLARVIQNPDSVIMLPFLIWMLSVIVYIGVLYTSSDPNLAGAAACILTILNPFWGVMQFISIFAAYGGTGLVVGISFSNWWSSGVGVCFLAQLVQIILYLSFIWSLNRAPRQRFTAEELKKAGEEANNAFSCDFIAGSPTINLIEELPAGCTIALDVKGLRKEGNKIALCKTGPPVTALRGLDLTILRGEVYGFLGQNSSGKSTTLSILAGEFLMSGGTAKFCFRDGDFAVADGHDDDIRTHLGFCAQSDLLYDSLTCREHLRLLQKLKAESKL
jgi:ABC-type multidrug transport system fused ATPase/permease subunit